VSGTGPDATANLNQFAIASRPSVEGGLPTCPTCRRPRRAVRYCNQLVLVAASSAPHPGWFTASCPDGRYRGDVRAGGVSLLGWLRVLGEQEAVAFCGVPEVAFVGVAEALVEPLRYPGGVQARAQYTVLNVAGDAA
jgi:hypothetical protein